MKKILPILALFLLGVINLSAALEPIRVSIVTTPFASRNVFIDILLPNGNASTIPTITKSSLSTDAGGVLSFVLNESDWTGLNFSTVRNHIVRISYNPETGANIIIGLQRLEDLISNQGLFGAVVDPNEVDAAGDYNFHSVTVGPDADGHYMTIPFGNEPLEIFQMVLKDNGKSDAEIGGNFLNKITFDAPTDVTEDYTITFPTAKPTFNPAFLTSDVSGNLDWLNLFFRPNHWKVENIFYGGLRDSIINEGPHWAISSDGIIKGSAFKLNSENYVVAEDADGPWLNIFKPAVGQTPRIPVLEADWDAGLTGYGLNINDNSGNHRSGIGYEPNLLSWIAGVQSPVYSAGPTPEITDIFMAGALTSGPNASVIVRHSHPPFATGNTDEVGFLLRNIESGYTESVMANPVFYVNEAGVMNFGIDIDGNVQMKGSITNDGVAPDGSHALNAVTIDDELVVKGKISNDGVASGSAYTNSVIVNDELLVNSTLKVNGFVTFAYSGNSYTFPAERGTDGQILQSDGFGVLSWANLPTVTLQTAYNGGRTITTDDGPVAITTTHVNGGLDVRASGAALDAIDAQLVGTTLTQQAAVQGIYTLGTITHYGYLGGNFGDDTRAGAVGSVGATGPYGALGVSLPDGGGGFINLAGYFNGDIAITGGIFAEANRFEINKVVSGLPVMKIYKPVGGSDVRVFELGYGSNPSGTFNSGYGMIIKDDNGDFRSGAGMNRGQWVTGVQGGGSSATPATYWAGARTTGGADATLGIVVDGTTVKFGADQNGDVFVGRNLSVTNELRFNEPSGSGTDYAAFLAPTLARNNTYTLPNATGTVGQVLTIQTRTATSATLRWATPNVYWGLSGNDVADDGSNFIGTIDDQPLIFKSNNVKAGEVSSGTNTSFGYTTLASMTIGTSQKNTAVGYQALNSNTWGSNSTAIGYRALQSSLGYENTAIGADAGNFYANGNPATACSTSVYVGAYTKAQNPAGSFRDNETVIGYGAIGNGTNTVTLGNASVTGLYSMGATTTTTEAPNMYINPTTGQIMLSTASSGGSLQVAYTAGHDISTTDGPIEITTTHVNGGLDVRASGAALDGIDVQLVGATGTQQAAVQGIYTLDLTGYTHNGPVYGFLAGNLGGTDNNRAGVIGSLGVGNPYGALGVLIYNNDDGYYQYAGYFEGDVLINGNLRILNTNSSTIEGSITIGTNNNDERIIINDDDWKVYDNGNAFFAGTLQIGSGANQYIFPSGRGSNGQFLQTDGAGTLSWSTASSGWGLSGNTVATDNSNFIGAINDYPLIFKINNTEAGRIARSTGNTSLGYSSLIIATGIANTAMGYESMKANVAGYYNSAYGWGSLSSNLDGNQNVAIGYNALFTNYSGNNNTAIGLSALYSNYNGYTNTGIGTGALFYNAGGYHNIGVGSNAGSFASGSVNNTTSNNSIYIGVDSKAGANGNTNEIVIGNNAEGSGNNSITLGHTTIDKTVTRGDVLITNSDDVANELRFLEPSGSGTEYVAFKSPALANNNTYTLPNAIGTAGQVLAIAATPTTTTASLEWTTPSGGGSGLSTFGYCYELATIVDATIVGGADVPFSNNGPMTNITHTPGTTTMITDVAGTYKIEYNITTTGGVGAQIAIAVNGTVQASTAVSLLNSTGTITGTAIISLAAGDVITLRNNSATPITMTLAPAVASQITIIILD